MAPLDDSTPDSASIADRDLTFKRQMRRLHELTIYGRWLMVGALWIGVAPLCLWGLRAEIALWQDYFTWTALRFGLAYNPVPTLGLTFCIGTTVAVLVWQSRTILFGLDHRQTQWLEQRLLQIRQQGPTHPLWKWIMHE